MTSQINFSEVKFWSLYRELALDPSSDLEMLLRLPESNSSDPIERSYYDFALAIKTYALCGDLPQFAVSCSDLALALIELDCEYGLTQMYKYKLSDYLEPMLRENTESIEVIF